jgi:PEP-CTERM motif
MRQEQYLRENTIMKLTLLGLIAIALCCAGPAMADSNLHIGTGTGTPCQSGCAGDPNLIGTGGTFDIAEVSNGANAGIASLILILAVPNDTTNALSIMVNGVTGTPEGFDNTTDIYTFLGLTSLNNSNNLGNLETADLANDGITATGYGIYEFAVGSILPGGFVELTSSGIPLGTFAFGEGVNGGGKLDGDAFTEAGLTTTGSMTTPEPSSLMLLASGLLGLGGLVRRKLIS